MAKTIHSASTLTASKHDSFKQSMWKGEIHINWNKKGSIALALTVTMLVFGLSLTAMRWIDTCERASKRSNQVFSSLYTKDAVIQLGMDSVLNKMSAPHVVWQGVTSDLNDYTKMLEKLDNMLLSNDGTIPIKTDEVVEELENHTDKSFNMVKNSTMKLVRLGNLELEKEKITEERAAGEPASYRLKPVELDLIFQSGNKQIRRRCRITDSQLQVKEDMEQTTAQLDFTQCKINLVELEYGGIQ